MKSVLLTAAACLLGLGLAACGGGTTPTAIPDQSCTSVNQPGDGPATADVLVYAATPSGVAAAIEAAHLGKRVAVLEPSLHIGGKFGGGIGLGEVKNLATVGGLARQFFDRVAAFPDSVASGTKFEPHVASAVISQMLCDQSGIHVYLGTTLASVTKSGNLIQSVRSGQGTTFSASQFIDASYEGDLMAAAGVTYTVGREAKSQYNEPLAGVQPSGLVNAVKFDPYIVPGDASSGLLPHISATPPGLQGTADRRIMAYTYRVCVTKNVDNRVPFAPPPGYDPAEFEALARSVEAKIANGDKVALDRIITLQGLPHGKFDVNNVKDIPIDYPEGSYGYIDATADQRIAIAKEHERYVRASLYFLATSPRLPQNIRDAASALGYCKDEYVDNDHFPYQFYIRELRRMVGPYVMTQNDAVNGTATQSIGLGAYYFDSHTVSVFADRGLAKAEGHTLTDVKPYQIPYAVLTPQPTEARNLLVSVSISASRVAFTSMRVEPTLMIMGQAAGAAAAMAIDQGSAVQDVDYNALAAQLTKDGQILSYSGG